MKWLRNSSSSGNRCPHVSWRFPLGITYSCLASNLAAMINFMSLVCNLYECMYAKPSSNDCNVKDASEWFRRSCLPSLGVFQEFMSRSIEIYPYEFCGVMAKLLYMSCGMVRRSCGL